MAEDHSLACSFCGKNARFVSKLIAGPGIYICDECVDLCNQIIREEYADSTLSANRPELPIDDAISQMVALHDSRQQVDREVAGAVKALRNRGLTWTRIGEALGISRQSAWERYSGEL